MKTGDALRLALRDLYGNSWRLVPANAALGAVLVAAGMAAVAVHAAVVLVVLAGPPAAALAHCAVKLVRTGDLELLDAARGLRAHWRRGLALGAGGAALAVLGVLAFHVYARAHAWPLVFLTIYLLVLLAIYQAVLWTLAIAEPERALREVAGEALAVGMRRPGATLLLGLALLVVNAAGLAAAVMPFLTITVAYSFVAVARFVLPAREGG